MTTILETLRPFGITRCYKGFPLTVYAIHLAVMEEDRLEEITEKIYRETADHFGCKWDRGRAQPPNSGFPGLAGQPGFALPDGWLSLNRRAYRFRVH